MDLACFLGVIFNGTRFYSKCSCLNNIWCRQFTYMDFESILCINFTNTTQTKRDDVSLWSYKMLQHPLKILSPQLSKNTTEIYFNNLKDIWLQPTSRITFLPTIVKKTKKWENVPLPSVKWGFSWGNKMYATNYKSLNRMITMVLKLKQDDKLEKCNQS